MGAIARSSILVGFLTCLGFGFSTVQAGEQKQAAVEKQSSVQTQGAVKDRWRYTFHNGEWWYWLPTNRWVYWRNDRWNTYVPQTYTPPRALRGTVSDFSDPALGRQTTVDMDGRPFYGRTLGDLDRRPTETNGEIGPFYGNPLPSDILGNQGDRSGSRPFYGRAESSGD